MRFRVSDRVSAQKHVPVRRESGGPFAEYKGFQEFRPRENIPPGELRPNPTSDYNENVMNA